MQPELRSLIPDAMSAVFAVNGEKPHQGVAGKNPGLHQRIVACNSTTALGVSWGLWSGTVPGARVTYEYDAYGNSFTVSGSTPNEMMYRGEQLDSDLGLYYLRARYYNPLTGRFMSRDPENGNEFDPKSLHKYLYVGGDPVNGLDPQGREIVAEYSLNINIIKVGAYAGLTALGAGIACEFIEDAEAIREAQEAAESNGAVVKRPGGITCGGTHPAPGGPGHPDEPEPPEPPTAPISGPPVAGAP